VPAGLWSDGLDGRVLGQSTGASAQRHLQGLLRADSSPHGTGLG